MPLFDYSCAGCGRVFESLVRSSELDTARPPCPDCSGEDTHRNTMAAFSVGSGGGSGPGAWRPPAMSQAGPGPGPGGCGGCGDRRGPGACSTN